MHTITVIAVSWTLANISGNWSYHSGTSQVVKSSIFLPVVLIHNHTISITTGFACSPKKHSYGARRKNRCSCAVDCGSSSRLSIFKMADDESKTNTSLSWLLAASCSLKALTNTSATLVNHPGRCFDCDRKDRNGVFSFIR